MSDRLEKMSIAKDETDAKNAELLLQVAGFQSRIDEHAKAAEEFEAALEKTKQVAQKERFQLESEVGRTAGFSLCVVSFHSCFALS